MSFQIVVDEEEAIVEPVTLAEIKSICRIDADYTSEDETLLLIAAAAREKLEGHLNLYFVEKSATLEFDQPKIELPYGPTGVITSVKRNGELLNEEDYELKGLQFKTIIMKSDLYGGDWFYPIGGGPPQYRVGTIYEEPVTYIVEYVTGYPVLPQGLKYALLTQIDFMFKLQGMPGVDSLSPVAIQLANRFSRNLPI